MRDIHCLEDCYELFRVKWWNSSSSFKQCLDKVTPAEKKKREKKLNGMLNKLFKHLDSVPVNDEDIDKWRQKGRRIIGQAIKKDDYFNIGDVDNRLRDNFIESTKTFIKTAREFDKNISIADIGQAMRNVWIINMIQSLLGEEIKFTKAIYGYSMLYPYTDNYLDNPQVSIEDKNEFNERFYKRLRGENIEPVNPNEEKVYKLVEDIESVFGRRRYPKVYESLYTIHEGQIKSLTQQDKVTIPYERDILGISIEKGGASVLVDGYLVNGDLTSKNIEFCVGYGFLLQVADDLQDVKEDFKNNHITIMSQLAGKYNLDPLANKLINFTIDLLEEYEADEGRDISNLKNLIKNNCVFLILFSMILSKEYFSEEYIRIQEEFLPFSMEYIENLKLNLGNKFKEIKEKNNWTDERLMDVLDKVIE